MGQGETVLMRATDGLTISFSLIEVSKFSISIWKYCEMATFEFRFDN